MNCISQNLPHRAFFAWKEWRVETAQNKATLQFPTPRELPHSQHPGKPHDYFSQADYWWPSDAGPYVRRDGEINPHNYFGHRHSLISMCTTVVNQLEAFLLTSDLQFIHCALEILHHWFVDPHYAISPHLNFGQVVPGEQRGRSYGIIDTVHLAEVALLLHQVTNAQLPSRYVETITRCRRWFQNYLAWLLESTSGKEESSHAHNHAVSYLLQITCFSLFAQDHTARTKETISRVFSHIRRNIFLPGTRELPTEVRRTRPRNYFLFCSELLYLVSLSLSSQILSRENELLSFRADCIELIDRCCALLRGEKLGNRNIDESSELCFPIESVGILGILSRSEELMNLWEEGRKITLPMEAIRNRPAKGVVAWIMKSGSLKENYD